MVVRWLPLLLVFFAVTASAIECPKGFDFRPNSGVGCVQTDCFAKGGHWSGTQACICGDYKTACTKDVDYKLFDSKKCGAFCPPKELLSCVAAGDKCPGQEKNTETKTPGPKVPAASGTPDATPAKETLLDTAKDISGKIMSKIQGNQEPQTSETSDPSPTTLDFLVEGGRAIHSVIGVAEPPKDDCPGGWILKGTAWQQISYRKFYVLPGYENYKPPVKPKGLVSGLWFEVKDMFSLAKSIVTSTPRDGRVEGYACDYVADHTWQCSSKPMLVKNIQQRKTVESPCMPKG